MSVYNTEVKVGKEKLKFKSFNKDGFEKYLGSIENQILKQSLYDCFNMDRSTTKEKAWVEACFKDMDLNDVFNRIGFSIVTMRRNSPIQSVIGLIATTILRGEREQSKVLITHQVASEIVLYLSNVTNYANGHIFEVYPSSEAGALMIRNLISSDEYGEKELYPLPLSKPHKAKKTDVHGSYKWENQCLDVYDMLNQTEFTVLDIEEPKKESWDEEQINKYEIRKQLKKDWVNRGFFFKWKPDYRGRSYASGYYFHPQGNEYEKNIIAFKEPCVTTLKGKREVYKAIMKGFKHLPDKCKTLESLRTKIDDIELELEYCNGAVKNNLEKQYEAVLDEIQYYSSLNLQKITDEENIRLWHENKSCLRDFIHLADEPTYVKAQFMSLEMIEKTGMTNIPIELDSTCSQAQMTSLMVGDENLARLSNLISDNKSIKDAYAKCADHMTDILEELLQDKNTLVQFPNLKPLKFNRGQIKKAFMIEGYGAGEKLIMEQLQEDLQDKYFDEAILIFQMALDRMSPAIKMLRDLFSKICWDKNRVQFNWTMPDGFVCDLRPCDKHNITVNPFGLQEISMIAQMIAPTTRSTPLGVGVTHSWDGYIPREIKRRFWNAGIKQQYSIHDGFRCLPEHAEFLRECYLDICKELAQSNLLNQHISEITLGSFKPNIQISNQFIDSINGHYAIS